jgi:hypothetical protein
VRVLEVVALVLLCGCDGVMVGPDGGAGVDASVPVDAGQPSDAGQVADAGPGTDAGVVVDAGTALVGWDAGSTTRSCSTPLPAEALALDTSHPTTVVGTGTAASCTFAALSAAVTQGGIITFACGPDPITIPITATLTLPTTRDTVLDGARKVTLDGRHQVQILHYESANFRALDTRVTVQHLRFINGFIAGASPIPTAPAPCSQGFNDGEGGAIFMRDGNLSVIDSIFENNSAAQLGPDVAGGAIRMLGSKNGIVIAHSTFLNNSASNGAGVGCLFAPMQVYDSVFEGNLASGHDANNNDPTQCSAMNNGQNETGSGGNGGALYSDGASVDFSLCGDEILGNGAGVNAFGGGLFFTSNDFGGDLVISDTTMTGNSGGHWTQTHGGMTNAGTAVGTNAKSLTITNSTLQGVP